MPTDLLETKHLAQCLNKVSRPRKLIRKSSTLLTSDRDFEAIPDLTCEN